MLVLHDALLLGKIADLESGEKVLLREAGGNIFSPGESGGWLKQGFEVSAAFIDQIVQIYNHRKEIIYSNSYVEIFITEAEAKLNDQPLYDEEYERSCYVCGCTYEDLYNCPDGRYWIDYDLCSDCVKVE